MVAVLLDTVAACKVIFPAVEEFLTRNDILNVTLTPLPVANVEPRVLIAVIRLGVGVLVKELPPRYASPEIVQPEGADMANFIPEVDELLLAVPSIVT